MLGVQASSQNSPNSLNFGNQSLRPRVLSSVSEFKAKPSKFSTLKETSQENSWIELEPSSAKTAPPIGPLISRTGNPLIKGDSCSSLLPEEDLDSDYDLDQDQPAENHQHSSQLKRSSGQNKIISPIFHILEDSFPNSEVEDSDDEESEAKESEECCLEDFLLPQQDVKQDWIKENMYYFESRKLADFTHIYNALREIATEIEA